MTGFQTYLDSYRGYERYNSVRPHRTFCESLMRTLLKTSLFSRKSAWKSHWIAFKPNPDSHKSDLCEKLAYTTIVSLPYNDYGVLPQYPSMNSHRNDITGAMLQYKSFAKNRVKSPDDCWLIPIGQYVEP